MYKYHLNDVDWGEFFIGGQEGIFNIQATKSGIDKNKLNMEDGNIPYITRSEIDNGINLFITDEQNEKYKKDQGNVITIGLDTQTVFYQRNAFFTGQNIQVLSNYNLNKNIAMFIIPLMKIQMGKFNWGGNGATLSRLNRTKIMLPIDKTNNPNWSFMEEYIKERENKQREDLKEYYKKRLLDLVISPEVLTDVEWGEFLIKNIFTIKSVKGKPVKNYEGGKLPYVTTSSLNNGVNDFVYANNEISKGNCISIDPIGGKTFYHKYEFIGRGGAGSAINLLYNKNLNQKTALFLCRAIEKTSLEKASYAVALNGERLKNAKMLLPIDKNGNPNWSYMENFIKNTEQKQIKNILKYLDEYIYI